MTASSITLITFFFSAFVVVFASAIPNINSEFKLEKRGGPSGELLVPKGGEVYDSFSGTGTFNISYKTVTGDIKTGQTAYLSVDLEPVSGGESVPIVAAFAGTPTQSPASGTIDGTFGLVDACGDYKVVVTENQMYQSSHIAFKAASPQVSITCGPIRRREVAKKQAEAAAAKKRNGLAVGKEESHVEI